MKLEMSFGEISAARLLSQNISENKFRTPETVVSWLVAVQAQDFGMSKWAIGVRLPDSTQESIQSAVSKSRIVRTHLLRPTWHLAAVQDVNWLIELSAPQIIASLRSRHKQLELSNSIISRSHGLLEKVLKNGEQLTREELVARYTSARFPLYDNRIAHLLLRAELDRIICSGAVQGGKPTYALFHDIVPDSKPVLHDEALAMLAKRYFDSRSPATISDFIWWSGLPSVQAKHAIEMVKTHLTPITVQSRGYLLSGSRINSSAHDASLHFLPAYDELLISYADRSASLSLVKQRKTISNNGVFRPVIVYDGKALGIWKRTLKKRKLIVEATFFQPPSRQVKDRIPLVSRRFSFYYGTETEIVYNSN